MKNKICCFAGHRDIYQIESLYDEFLNLVERLVVSHNVSEFWVGNYGIFDRYSARIVRELKGKYPFIQLNLVIPYLTNSVSEIKNDFDNIIVADIKENTPRNLKIIKCNEYMVEKSDYIICYVKNCWGGAGKTLEFAKKNKCIKIYNLYNENV